jgi:hypothetical protein
MSSAPLPNHPLTRVELDKLRCPCGKVDFDCEIWLKQLCHPSAGAIVSYNQKTHILNVRCKECENWIAEIYVMKDLIVV